MSSLRLFWVVALVPVIAIRLQTSGNHRGETMAASFGGGGCLSFLSQIGYLRGLLADDVESGEGVTLTTIASSSGGSWAVGNLFDTLANISTGPTGFASIKDSGKLIQSKKESHWENELGRWCMFHQMNQGVSRDQWSIEMMACAQCAQEPGNCTHKLKSDPIFGVAHKCITYKQHQNADREEQTPLDEIRNQGFEEVQKLLGVQKSNLDLQSEIQSKISENPLRYSSYPMPLPEDARDVPVLGQALQVHGHFLPQDKNRKLSDIASVFSDQAGGKTYWSIFWTGLTPNGTVTRGSSGSAATSDYNMGEAMYMSSDAISAINVWISIWQSIMDPDPIKCLQYAQIINEQTTRNSYPWPFETAPGLPPLEFPSNWRHAGVDGCIMDNNAVGEAVRLMDSLPFEERPKSLTSLITGAVNGNTKDTDLDINNVVSYFREKVKWSSLFDAGRDILNQAHPQTCKAVLDRVVKNPNHFFEYKGLVSVRGHETCDASVMLSRKHNEHCYNFAYQADTTGSVFVRKANVVENQFWSIKGGWTVDIFFTILDSNPAADRWKLDVYNDDTMALKHLQRFPVLPGNEDEGNSLEQVSPFQAFALMNYNSYKGYMAHCALLHYQSNGQKGCSYCKNRQNAKECAKWLPFLSNN